MTLKLPSVVVIATSWIGILAGAAISYWARNKLGTRLLRGPDEIFWGVFLIVWFGLMLLVGLFLALLGVPMNSN